MKLVSDSYATLVTKLNAICQLKRCQSVLNYDQMVFMPKNPQTAAERGAQLSALAGLIHEKSTDKEILRLIEKSMEDLQQAKIENKVNNGNTCTADLLFSDESRVLELEAKTFLEMERVPAALAEKRAALSAKAHQVWATARQNDDFSSFAPVLSECFQTSKELAIAKRGDDETKTLYNQMLDEFEPGMAVDRIDEIFQQIRDALVPFISKVLSSPYKPSTNSLRDSKFPIEKQKEVGKKIVEAMGFKEEFGRMDVSVHPFTSSSSPYDVRITSRFSEDEWKDGLTATIHEAGHGTYTNATTL
jgi:carboxypeptidase Taq